MEPAPPDPFEAGSAGSEPDPPDPFWAGSAGSELKFQLFLQPRARRSCAPRTTPAPSPAPGRGAAGKPLWRAPASAEVDDHNSEVFHLRKSSPLFVTNRKQGGLIYKICCKLKETQHSSKKKSGPPVHFRLFWFVPSVICSF